MLQVTEDWGGGGVRPIPQIIYIVKAQLRASEWVWKSVFVAVPSAAEVSLRSRFVLFIKPIHVRLWDARLTDATRRLFWKRNYSSGITRWVSNIMVRLLCSWDKCVVTRWSGSAELILLSKVPRREIERERWGVTSAGGGWPRIRLFCPTVSFCLWQQRCFLIKWTRHWPFSKFLGQLNK